MRMILTRSMQDAELNGTKIQYLDLRGVLQSNGNIRRDLPEEVPDLRFIQDGAVEREPLHHHCTEGVVAVQLHVGVSLVRLAAAAGEVVREECPRDAQLQPL